MLYTSLRRKLMNEDIMELVVYSYPNPVTDVKIRLQYPEMKIDKELCLQSVSESYPFECDIAHVKNAEGEVLLAIEYLDTNDISPIAQAYKLDIKKAISPLHFKEQYVMGELQGDEGSKITVEDKQLYYLRVMIDNSISIDDVIVISYRDSESLVEETKIEGKVGNIMTRYNDEYEWSYTFHNIPIGTYIINGMLNSDNECKEIIIIAEFPRHIKLDFNK